MSLLSTYRDAQSLINQPASQLAGQIDRLMEQVKNGQDQIANAVTQLKSALDQDAERETPLLDAATVTDVHASLAVLKAGGEYATGRTAVGLDVLDTLIDSITGAGA